MSSTFIFYFYVVCASFSVRFFLFFCLTFVVCMDFVFFSFAVLVCVCVRVRACLTFDSPFSLLHVFGTLCGAGACVRCLAGISAALCRAVGKKKEKKPQNKHVDG